MGSEIRFALRCRASKQRPRLRRNCSNCLDEKEAFANNPADGIDVFNTKTQSSLNINQDLDGNTYVPTSLEMLSSNSNLFHNSNQVKPHTITPIRRGTTGLYHRNISSNLQTHPFSSKDNDNYSQFLPPKREYYRFCSNKNQNQCAQTCICEHYALDHHS